MHKLLVITALVLAAMSAALAQPGQSVEFDPGEPMTTYPAPAARPETEMSSIVYDLRPKEGETLPDGRLVGTPQGELPATQADINALREEWREMDRQASSAQRRGDGRSFARARQRANSLAFQISALTSRVEGMAEYLHSQSFSNDLQDRGFLIQETADKRYVLRPGIGTIPPAAQPAPSVQPPASPVNDKPAEPARRNGSMNAILWTALAVFGALGIAWLIWSQINNGILIARGPGWLTNLTNQANQTNQQTQAVPAAAAIRTLADPPAVGETAAHRQEIGAPNPAPVKDPSVSRGWRVSGPWGTASGESWETRPRQRRPAKSEDK